MNNDDNLRIKIFDKLYVTFRRHGNSMPVAQLVNYIDNKTNLRIRDRMDEWARWGSYGKDPLNSLTIDNKPMVGFRISRSQINDGWYQTPEYIRIEDPRGFEVDITIPNMIMLTNDNALVNGEIMHECIWGRDNAVNVLLPVNSLPYREAVSNTDRQKTHVHVSKLKLGDHVTLKNGQSGRYMGKLYSTSEIKDTIRKGTDGYYYYSYGSRDWQASIFKYKLGVEDKPIHYIEQEYKDHNGFPKIRYLGYASPNVSRVEKEDPLTKAEVNDRLFEAFKAGLERSDSYNNTIFLTTDKPEVRGWGTVPATTQEIEQHWERTNKNRGELMLTFFGRKHSEPEQLLAFQQSYNFKAFATNINGKLAKIDDAEFAIETESIKEPSFDVSDIAFEQLMFDLYIPETNQTFKIKI
jgi:hypothetical protein